MCTNILNDSIHKHFNHPVPCVVNAKTIGELITMDDKDLLKIRNFGKKSLEKIKEFRKLQIEKWTH